MPRSPITQQEEYPRRGVLRERANILKEFKKLVKSTVNGVDIGD
jgi:hypothetical protein